MIVKNPRLSLICDVGSGTVDLIIYTVSSLKPMLRLREVILGTGSMCGVS